MGCASSVGCLGPKSRQRAVYVNMIESIHAQAKDLTIKRDQSVYEQIKDRVNKRGFLRKLNDNLISHKNHIYECVSQNLQIVKHTQNSNNRVAGLVIIDSIVKMLKDDQVKGSQIQSSNITTSSVNNELGDQRLQHLFFQLMLVLFKKQPQIYQYQLNSMVKVLGHRRDQKLASKTDLYPILQVLRTSIKEKKQVELSLSVYQKILTQMKENIRDNVQDQESLMFFLKLCMSYSGQILQGSRKIIQVYLHRFYGNYDLFYSSFIEILQQQKFTGQKVQKLQEIILNTIESSTLANFQNGFIMSLIKHLKKCEGGLQWRINGFKYLSEWMSREDKQIQKSQLWGLMDAYLINMEKTMLNADKEKLKRRFFQVISILGKEYCQEIVSQLVQAVRNDDFNDQRKISMVNTITQLMQTKNMAQNQQNNTNLDYLICLKKHYSLELRLELIKFAKILVKSSIPNSQEGYNGQSHLFKQNLSQFLHSWFQQFSENQFSQRRNCDIINKIFSLSSPLRPQEDSFRLTVLSKQCLLGQLVTFFKFLASKLSNNHLNSLIFSFISEVQFSVKQFLQRSRVLQDVSVVLYFYISVIQQILATVQKTQSLFDSLIKINSSLEKGLVTLQTKNWILEVFNQIVNQANKKQKYQQQKNKQKVYYASLLDQLERRKNAASTALNVPPLKNEQYTALFKELFRAESNGLLFEFDKTADSRLKFKRTRSVASIDDLFSEKNKSKQEDEDSICEIIQRIQDR